MSFISELQRRNVFRVFAAYLVVGWLLTEVLTTLLPEFGAPDWVSRAVMFLYATGFIPVIVLSWVYEITPEGIKRESDLADGERPSSPGFAYATIGLAIVLTIAVAVLSARTDIGTPSASDAQPASVAVLPFVNMSADPDNEYFSDGLTETLLHMITQIPGLQVAARTSSFSFKGQNTTIREIARTLGVAHVLEGSVQRAGNRVRITAQLIRADDGFHVWSQNYDRELDDIFAIQDEIATEVGSVLSESLLGGVTTTNVASVGTENTDAYNLYLQAMSARATFSYGGLEASENLLKGALAIDPNYVDAKVQLAYNYRHQAITGLMEPDDARSEIIALTEQVLTLQPNQTLARALRLFVDAAIRVEAGDVGYLFQAIDELEQLVVEKPAEYDIRLLLAALLGAVQQTDRALEINLEALERDPRNARIHYEIGTIYADRNDTENARASILRSLEYEPRQPNAYVQLAQVSLQEGDAVDFVRQSLSAMQYDPRDHELPAMVAGLLYNLELVEEGDDFRDRVIAIAPTSTVSYTLDVFRGFATGDETASIAAARRAIEDDIEERNLSYAIPVMHLMRVAARTGTIDETIAFIEQNAPGIFEIEADNVSPKYRAAQIYSLDGFYAGLPRDEFRQRLDALLQTALNFGIDPLTDPIARMTTQAYRGDTDAAISTALNDVFPKSVTSDLLFEQTFAQAQYSEFLEDERIAEALQVWRGEWAAIRESVRDFLADLSAG